MSKIEGGLPWTCSRRRRERSDSTYVGGSSNDGGVRVCGCRRCDYSQSVRPQGKNVGTRINERRSNEGGTKAMAVGRRRWQNLVNSAAADQQLRRRSHGEGNSRCGWVLPPAVEDQPTQAMARSHNWR